MHTILFTFALILSTLAMSQVEVTLYGDSSDKNIQQEKERLESKGFTVEIKAERPTDEDKDVHPFIKRWTGKKLPDWKLRTLEGKEVSTADLRGKNIHLNLWSITCKPCIEEFHELNQLKEKYKEDWIFLALAPESQEKVQKVVSEHSLDYMTVANVSDIFESMDVQGYPKNLFVDDSGNIVKVTDGTHYKMTQKNNKISMVPDNFRIYDEIIQNFKSK